MALRAVIAAGLLVLVVAAFSLRDLPGPRQPAAEPEAYRPTDALVELGELSRRFPARRAGSPGDGGLADAVAASLRRAARGMVVRRTVEQGDTPDGRRQLVEVTGTLPGPPGPELVVVSHRDAVRPGARAELSGTAAMLELARALGRGRTSRTVRFVSVSGGSGGGLAGATRLARRLDPAGTRAVLVLGDVATPGSRGLVVPWSNDAGGMTPPILLRTAILALRREGVGETAEPRLGAQVVRQALPATTGEQGEFLQRGIPAVTLSAARTTAASGSAISPGRMAAFGRAALRTVQAIDPPAATLGTPRTRLTVLDRELPLWVLRFAMLVVLVPALVGLVAGARALAAEPRRLVAGVAHPLAAALPPLLVGAAAVAMARTGLLGSAPAGPFDGAALQPGLVGWSLLVALAVVAALAVVGGRPAILRALAPGDVHGPPDGVSRAWGVAAVVLPLVAVLFVVVPLAAALLLPAAVLWPLAATDDPPLPLAARRGLLLLGAAPGIASVAVVAWSLGVPAHELPWWATLLVAGGHLSIPALVVGSLVLGACATTVAVLLPTPAERLRMLPPAVRRRRERERREGSVGRLARTTPPAPAPAETGPREDDEAAPAPPEADEWAWEQPARRRRGPDDPVTQR